MDDASLSDLLARATVPEPPIGPVAQNALREGLRLRRRRRTQYAAGCAAAVAVACAATLAVTQTAPPALPAAAPGKSETVYALSDSPSGATITPIAAATGRPGDPIVLPQGTPTATSLPQVAITPDGKTIWAAHGDTVTPISTGTNRAGRPVTLRNNYDVYIVKLVVAPNGKNVYVLDSSGTVTPISTVTDRAGISIKPEQQPAPEEQPPPAASIYNMAITPNGKTLYVLVNIPQQRSYVVPIVTATNTPAAPIWPQSLRGIAILSAPDGQTAYLVGTSSVGLQVIPISTATNSPGTPVSFATGQVLGSAAMTPDGHTIYLTTARDTVIQFSTITDKVSRTFNVGSADGAPLGFATTPDGGTAYFVSGPHYYTFPCSGATVTPVSTVTGAPGEPINVDCPIGAVAISPDGSTLWLGEQGGVQPISTATGHAEKPISTATGHAGKPIPFGPVVEAIVIAP
jgi:hypothetical protein